MRSGGILFPTSLHGPSYCAAICFAVFCFSPAKPAFAQSELPDSPSVTMSLSQLPLENNQKNRAGVDNKYVTASEETPISSLVKRGIKDQQEIYAAPFRKGALKWDIGISAITAGLISTDPDVSGAFPSPANSFSRRTSDFGLYGTMGSVGVFYAAGAFTHNPHAKETGFLGAEAIANAAVTYTLLKAATGRERPFIGTENGRFWHSNHLGSSFPSGHSAVSWAAAAVIAHEYPKRWVQILAYGTAAAVAITRVSSRQHFPSDAFFGSAVGYFIGSHIFEAHCQAGLSSSCD